MRRGFFFALALLAPVAHAERWKVQYFFDELKKTLYIEDLAFPSSTRGIAVGTIVQENSSKTNSIALLTNDGGVHWSEQPIKDHPRSIFFLNDSVGWMVGEEAIWMTEESGHSWRKVGDQRKPDKKIGSTPPGGLITRVWFLDTQHGFAVGLQKSVLETHRFWRQDLGQPSTKRISRRPILPMPSTPKFTSRVRNTGSRWAVRYRRGPTIQGCRAGWSRSAP